MHILVVAPDEETRRKTSARLGGMGYTVAAVGSIREAGELIAGGGFDVAVLDTGMRLDVGELPAVYLTEDWAEMREQIARAA